MRLLVSVACLLAMTAGAALAEGPHVSYGPPGQMDPQGERQDYCQYGFQDDGIGWGYTLGLGQQLGMTCPGPICIDEVGFFVEFMVTYGQVDIVIFDDGTEVYRQTVSPDAGNNNFVLNNAVNVNGTACIMICPIGNYWSVLGEDMSNGPFGSTYFSANCTCETAFTDINLTIWAHLCGVVPTENETWGTLRSLYR